ncbi:hypothetical protein NDU88_006208 [Pleurodeles waltl]|uniref:Uncharacterized protein n=1 Tax=Pleurodeles waltl TaxID=8319 RepID=A0AAV7WXK9_PLEWA|nr:hypothetical protein NDU88_006208 [Pleurodeles waltl]
MLAVRPSVRCDGDLTQSNPHRQCLRGTTQSSDPQEVSINLDIRVDSSLLTGQKGNTDEVKAGNSRKPEEARSEESHGDEEARRDDKSEESHKDERGEEGKKETGWERLHHLRPLDERTRHVPEGAWLSQV